MERSAFPIMRFFPPFPGAEPGSTQLSPAGKGGMQVKPAPGDKTTLIIPLELEEEEDKFAEEAMRSIGSPEDRVAPTGATTMEGLPSSFPPLRRFLSTAAVRLWGSGETPRSANDSPPAEMESPPSEDTAGGREGERRLLPTPGVFLREDESCASGENKRPMGGGTKGAHTADMPSVLNSGAGIGGPPGSEGLNLRLRLWP